MPYTKKDYRKAIEKLGLSQGEASVFLGLTDRTGRRYAAGKGIPQAVGMLLDVMIEEQLTPAYVSRITETEREED